MNIFSPSNASKLEVKSIAIGTFDALHLGHFALINKLKQGALLVIDRGSQSLLVPNYFKEEIAKIPVFFLSFDEIKSMSAKDFVAELLRIFPVLEFFVCGYDFRFGKNRAAGAKELKECSKLPCREIAPVKINGVNVHSSLIKECLLEAKVKLANLYLGRTYCIKARIIKGQGLGRSDFVPTINLYENGFFLPKEGIYASKTRLKNRFYSSISFLGHRSTDGKLALETHILGSLDESEKEDFAYIYFLEFLQEVRRFESFSELKTYIDFCVKEAKIWHEANDEC